MSKEAINKPMESKDAISNVTIYPSTPQRAVDAAFLKSVGKPKAGANEALDTFLTVMNRLTSNLASWSFSDVIYYAAPFAFDTILLREYFEKWTDAQIKFGKVEETPTCYSDSLYIKLN